MRTEIIELPEKFVEQLAQLPQSGRFLHKVKVTLQSGEVLTNRIVFNSSVLHLEEGEMISPEEITNIELDTPVFNSNQVGY
jgi:sulfatase maturation enzyme AslB (radical SAM superfamily)